LPRRWRRPASSAGSRRKDRPRCAPAIRSTTSGGASSAPCCWARATNWSSFTVAARRRRQAQGKARIFDELRQTYANLKKDEWGGYSGYDRWFEQPLTNAHLAAVATYQQWVPAFTALLAQCDGDWDRFYAAARKIGDLPPAERDAACASWRRPPPR
jgi:predicted aminopeptidase